MRLFVFLISFCVAFIMAHLFFADSNNVKIAAYVRVKDEINTVIPCLDSIDGLFDKIVIIHSNEPDDGSVDAMNTWCKWRLNCHIYEYPYAVIPSHQGNQKKIKYENSLAAYNNFGLSKFEPEEYVAKIDADQIYIHPHLKQTLDFIRSQDKINDKISYGIKGYNTFIYKGKLVKFEPNKMNGGRDSFIIKRKYMERFNNAIHYEKLKNTSDISYRVLSAPSHWFHFMKNLKTKGNIRQNDDVNINETAPLSNNEKQEFEQYIRPLLIKHNSSYKNISL